MNISLVFDGGAAPNPGHGYGSYRLMEDGREVAMTRLTFGEGYTNNQAEWRTLAEALEYVRSKYGIAFNHLHVRGDSSLVINGAARKWRVKHPRLKPYAQRVWAAIDGAESVSFEWRPRSESVAILGH